MLTCSRFLLIGLLLSPALVAQGTPKETPLPQAAAVHPTRFSEDLWVLPSGWTERVPGRGAVNAPGRIEALAPGQRVALALVVEGPEREKALEGRTLDVFISGRDGTRQLASGVSPAVRRIKASGSDFVMQVLGSAGIDKGKRAELDELTSLISLAVFELPWEAPEVGMEEFFKVEIIIKGGTTPPPTIKALSMQVRPWKAWWRDKAPTAKDLEAFSKGFHEDPRPGHLLPMLKVAAGTKGFEQAAVQGFFATAFRAHPAARRAAKAELARLDDLERWALLLVLKLGGEDLSGVVTNLPKEAVASLGGVEPLPDPPALLQFTDPVDPEQAAGMGIPMDLNWAAWMATGNPRYLRELVGLLGWASDYPVCEAWMKSKGGRQGLNAKVARGLAYLTAGWSLASFQRSDPQVADWLLYWQKDPSMPMEVRQQLLELATNPAFRREQR